ncbi:hypothetical protein BOTBODRAFT_594593 [Botryobasidium botryosum FD-172 SS1]|uniref:Uncharacterized protein n=1 Tax=Botryobasidium botryosum (strain FD-172 SS1) TaxID=930990 RepID=A0A067LWU5_BOTB1|nr:hypothetical protein BOTBODRAFT_594593 [Botryobasidium botryosum FD-172 SS1]
MGTEGIARRRLAMETASQVVLSAVAGGGGGEGGVERADGERLAEGRDEEGGGGAERGGEGRVVGGQRDGRQRGDVRQVVDGVGARRAEGAGVGGGTGALVVGGGPGGGIGAESLHRRRCRRRRRREGEHDAARAVWILSSAWSGGWCSRVALEVGEWTLAETPLPFAAASTFNTRDYFTSSCVVTSSDHCLYLALVTTTSNWELLALAPSQG